MTTSVQANPSVTPTSREIDSLDDLRNACHGTFPLSGRLESWMTAALTDADNRAAVLAVLDRYGSPTHFLSTQPMLETAKAWTSAAEDRGLNFQVYFARKANKALCFVDAALHGGLGIDTASDPEVSQTLERGFPADRVVCTAAIKNSALIDRCIEAGVTLVVDNLDEWRQVVSATQNSGATARIAFRLSGFWHAGEKLHSRFGIDVDDLEAMFDRQLTEGLGSAADVADVKQRVEVVGLHFHLDGYDADQRVSAIHQCLPWVLRLRSLGHPVTFVDIGGGVPMSYLEDEDQWTGFWKAHERCLLDPEFVEVTHRRHPLGRRVLNDRVDDQPNVYPFFQQPIGIQWWQKVWDADLKPIEGFRADTVAGAFVESGLQMRCEPGRSLLDGCGMTAATIRFRKRHPKGFHYIGLEMNRTQCRTTTDDFLVDPILVRRGEAAGEAMSGFFVGSYCTESELISLRRMEIPRGCEVGDVVIFPNTAGYLMHFLESRSHQFPLAANVVLTSDSAAPDRQAWRRDLIDEMSAGC